MKSTHAETCQSKKLESLGLQRSKAVAGISGYCVSKLYR